MAEDKSALDALRQQINDVDMQIQTLLNQRAHCALQIAEIKREANKKPGQQEVVFYRPERESQILRQLLKRNQGPMPDHAMVAIFREIMAASLAMEKQLQVAYLGPEGTFTQAAAARYFGHAIQLLPAPTIDAVFRQVEGKQADYGVVPVENSTEGMVAHTLDNLMRSTLKICGEVELPIHLHLLTSSGTERSELGKVYAHQQALAQCRNWLSAHLPQVKQEAVSSNGEAARRAMDQEGTAAIAGDMAAVIYDLKKEAEFIEDRADNLTRFLAIGRDDIPPSGADKSAILVGVRDRPGALFTLLEPFHEQQLSLTRIDSRPSGDGPWAYVFFMEFEGHIEDPRVTSVMAALEQRSSMLKHLGSYPKAAL